jgi:hypothetical protein
MRNAVQLYTRQTAGKHQRNCGRLGSLPTREETTRQILAETGEAKQKWPRESAARCNIGSTIFFGGDF